MIDLGKTRATLLAEIGATGPAGEPLNDITDPRVATEEGRVCVRGHGRDDLFPLLKLALSERFAAVPRLRLIRDLLSPLKNVLGNAYKHGNSCDSTKTVAVEIVLSRKGTLIAVTDEGRGFDVARTFQRFQAQENYYKNHGTGFRNLNQATSTVSYENGGRTALLCFRPGEDPGGDFIAFPASAADATSVAGAFRGKDQFLPKIFDSKWMRACLSAELPDFDNGRAKIESCRVYAIRARADDDCGNRYALRVASHDPRPAETRILTGRLHATEAAAAADFAAATTLRQAAISKRVLIPRPVARLAGEPRLVLHDFDPWMNLWEYLTNRGTLKAVRHAVERTGEALARLHQSRVLHHGFGPDAVGEKLQARVARAQATLQNLPNGRNYADRFRDSIQRTRPRSAAPIHGAFGWDCIHCGVDGRFYLYRFEHCRRCDPGLDLGGFAADLLCFTLANYDAEAYGMCRNTFLSNYNSNVEHPMGEDDLHAYVTLALAERLQRAQTHASMALWLDALDVAIGNRHLESEVV